MICRDGAREKKADSFMHLVIHSFISFYSQSVISQMMDLVEKDGQDCISLHGYIR